MDREKIYQAIKEHREDCIDIITDAVAALIPDVEQAKRETEERIIQDIAEHNVINTFGKKGFNNLGLLLTAEFWQTLRANKE